jgi:hypothetical protein
MQEGKLAGGRLFNRGRVMAEVLRSSDSVQDREIVVERADGSRGVVLVNIAPLKLKDRSGNILGAVNCFQDVTERKRSERQIAILAGEAEHRAKNILATVQATVHLSLRQLWSASKTQSKRGSGRSLRSMRCSFSRAGQEPSYLASLSKNSRHTFEKVSCVCELLGQICF